MGCPNEHEHFQQDYYLGKLKNRKIIESFTNQPANLSNNEGYVLTGKPKQRRKEKPLVPI